MDNKTAFWLALIIVCIFAADFFYFDWGLMLTIGKLIAVQAIGLRSGTKSKSHASVESFK